LQDSERFGQRRRFFGMREVMSISVLNTRSNEPDRNGKQFARPATSCTSTLRRYGKSPSTLGAI
jgi:hypothetical protein